jgi:AcrR family transcriptional regulator
MAPLTEDPAVDGRTQRTTRSRERIVGALIDLVEEGYLRPTGQQVADRAGMNLRTVFRHFEDMEALHRAVHEQLERTLRPELEEDPPTGSLRERLSSFVRRRARVYERIAPYQRAERLHRWNSTQLQSVHKELIDQLDRDLVLWLPEVADLPTGLRAGVELIASYEAWDRLREEQCLGPRQTITVLEATLEKLLDHDHR